MRWEYAAAFAYNVSRETFIIGVTKMKKYLKSIIQEIILEIYQGQSRHLQIKLLEMEGKLFRKLESRLGSDPLVTQNKYLQKQLDDADIIKQQRIRIVELQRELKQLQPLPNSMQNQVN